MRICVLLLLISLLSACHKDAKTYNGYIDADLSYLSSDFSGRLTTLMVHRGDSVKKDQCLFKLEQTSETFGVEMSQFNQQNLLSQQKEIESNLRYSETNYRRTLHMKQQNAASQNDLDKAKNDLEVLQDSLRAIQSQISSSQTDIADKKWRLQRKEGKAMQAGLIFDTYYTPGEYIPAGTPVVSLITPKNIKVVFFVPETELNHILLHAPITLSSDSNPTLAKGNIRYISNIAQYTPPIIYSREERASLVFRVEAAIDAPNLNQIHLGQPVTIRFSK